MAVFLTFSFKMANIVKFHWSFTIPQLCYTDSYTVLFQHNKHSGDNTKYIQTSSTQPADVKPQEQQIPVQISAEELLKDVPPDKLAVQLTTVAIEGSMANDLSDSGGEGMYRERDEFVVKNEDIERLRVSWHIIGTCL